MAGLVVRSLQVLGFFLLGCFAVGGHAADLKALLIDSRQQPLANAVITLRGPLGQTASVPASPTALMDQRGKQFVPHVLAVRTGTSVSFPNSDDIRHHVYSFSPAKRFELRLYQDTPSEPVLFDQPGLVVLGCNIHDWMLGYVYVTDDPWYAVSDKQGRADLRQLSSGRYAVTLWHPANPDMQPQQAGEIEIGAATREQRFSLLASGPAQIPAPPAPSAFGEAFRKAAEDAAH